MQVEEAWRVPIKMNTKRPTQRHIIIKMLKVKDKENIKSSKRKAVTYRGIPISLSVYFSKETWQGRRNWQEVFKVMKSKHLHLDYSIR